MVILDRCVNWIPASSFWRSLVSWTRYRLPPSLQLCVRFREAYPVRPVMMRRSVWGSYFPLSSLLLPFRHSPFSIFPFRPRRSFPSDVSCPPAQLWFAFLIESPTAAIDTITTAARADHQWFLYHWLDFLTNSWFCIPLFFLFLQIWLLPLVFGSCLILVCFFRFMPGCWWSFGSSWQSC